jgi:hypothetical protein
MRKLSMALLAGVALVGCGVDQETENKEIVSNLIEAGFQADDINVVDGQVYVGGDAHVSLAASQEMLQGAGSEEQYRTTNLVGTGVSKICVNPTSSFNSYANLSAGLDAAIANYNARGLRIYFARGPSTGCTANITATTTSGAGGSAGFPSGGLPYGTINIGTGMSAYSAGVNKHVISHELGHTIGFRHSDYYNRAISCGGAVSNEGASTVGAILIPGTPSTATVGGSVMNSCFSSSSTGTWTSSDITATTMSGAGGSAGFPSGGYPYGTINIGTGMSAYAASVNKHVIAHELGHCIGFRHSDYYNRAISCGGAVSNEGASTVGAILIPGTPSTATVGGSVMNSCFSSTSTGADFDVGSLGSGTTCSVRFEGSFIGVESHSRGY